MNKAQKEVQQAQLNDEKKVIKLLELVYEQAKKDCEQKIRELSARTDLENLQSIVYQKEYQQMMVDQLEAMLYDLHEGQFTTIADYLEQSYINGYVGMFYDLQSTGIPLVIPIQQDQVVKALKTNSKLSSGLYKRLGEDVDYLKRSIRAELSRGISSGSSWNEMAVRIAKGMNSPFRKAYNNAIRIARTEGHRIQNEAALDGQRGAKKKGADIVKQWDSTLDGRTRDEHRECDGQIREIDEPFDVGGEKMQAPGVGGSAKNVCNCRCCLLQRAKWALDDDELKTLQERAEIFGLDKTKSFNDFKQKYLKVVEKPIAQLKNCEDDFMKLTGGYSYDDFMNDFGSIEEGFKGAEEDDIRKAREIADKIEILRHKLNQGKKSTKNTIRSREESVEMLNNLGIRFKDNTYEGLSDSVLSKFADFTTNFEYDHAGYFTKNKLQLDSITIVDRLKENGTTAAGAYYSKSKSIKLMKKAIESKPTSKLITYSKSDDYQMHFFAHEYGHYIADSLNMNFAVSDSDVIQNSLLRYFKEDIFKAKTSNLVNELGSYGSTNAREAFAEAFAEAYTCKEPGKFAKIFKEELEKTLNCSSSSIRRYQSSIANSKGNDIINSGAVKGALTDKNDPLYIKRDAHAAKYYESVRRSKKSDIVKSIANNTGISEKSINKVYDHVFVNDHELYGGKRRFDPDYDMAESFRRLREGKNIQEHDLIMLKHERLEYELMEKEHLSYQEAHQLAEKKYNYQRALMEFKEKNNL